MTRSRVAIALGVVAVLAVLATAAVAISTYGGDEDPPAPTTPAAQPLVVHDPASGASFEVPGDGWTVRDAQTRIYYDDAQGDPVAVVRGPAVFRDGYCEARPRGSSRAFAGFTEQPFEDWVDAIGVQVDESRSGLVRRATVRTTGTGPCVAREVEVAMRSVDDVRVVLVSDAGALSTSQVDAVLTSLVLRD
ncbi:hypothetical protein ABLE68_12270 [Nocardioides sp. CN2-186]|uniref:hypothetical protein n=1 Tax=Nocardioides tweenelious TaxID=3156607 RepID=UPI0032B5E2D6